jgi:hypothetical protein
MGRILLFALCIAGCARTPAEQAARDAERQKRAHCGALEVYPMGVTPPRPYRVLGPVQVSANRNPSSRDRALRDSACGLGADAVMDVSEQVGLGTAQGATGGLMAAADESITATGTAIAFTDVVTPPQ